jgi:hypothetical protein
MPKITCINPDGTTLELGVRPAKTSHPGVVCSPNSNEGTRS